MSAIAADRAAAGLPPYVAGEPQPTDHCTVEQLKAMGLSGYYLPVEEPADSGLHVGSARGAVPGTLLPPEPAHE